MCSFYVCVFYLMHLNAFFWERVFRFHQTLKAVHGTDIKNSWFNHSVTCLHLCS
jgi:hypothetical protein